MRHGELAQRQQHFRKMKHAASSYLRTRSLHKTTACSLLAVQFSMSQRHIMADAKVWEDGDLIRGIKKKQLKL